MTCKCEKDVFIKVLRYIPYANRQKNLLMRDAIHGTLCTFYALMETQHVLMNNMISHNSKLLKYSQVQKYGP